VVKNGKKPSAFLAFFLFLATSSTLPLFSEDTKAPEGRVEANPSIPFPQPIQKTASAQSLDLGLTANAGAIWPNGTLSSMPLGMGPDYGITGEVLALAAWYWDSRSALTLSLGYARRNLCVTGILEENAVRNAKWPIDYGIMRTGYRAYSTDIFYLEGGFTLSVPLYTAKATFAPAVNTASTQYSTPVSFSLFIAIGAKIPLANGFSFLSAVTFGQALSTTISGNTPTATDVSGNVVSSAPLRILPTDIALLLGIVKNFTF